MVGRTITSPPVEPGIAPLTTKTERSVLVVKGAVPGATGGDVIVRPTIKA